LNETKYDECKLEFPRLLSFAYLNILIEQKTKIVRDKVTIYRTFDYFLLNEIRLFQNIKMDRSIDRQIVKQV